MSANPMPIVFLSATSGPWRIEMCSKIDNGTSVYGAQDGGMCFYRTHGNPMCFPTKSHAKMWQEAWYPDWTGTVRFTKVTP